MSNQVSKEIEKFIQLAIKTDFDVSDKVQLKELVYRIPNDELKWLWFHWTSSTAFSRSQAIPDWKVKDQRIEFEFQLSDFSYNPGKLSFEDHVISQLTRYIEEEKALNIRYKNLPFVNKYIFSPLGYLVLILFIVLLCSIVRTAWSGILSLILFLAFMSAPLLINRFRNKKFQTSKNSNGIEGKRKLSKFSNT